MVIFWNEDFLSRIPELRSLVTELGGQPIIETVDWYSIRSGLADRYIDNVSGIDNTEDSDDTESDFVFVATVENANSTL